ncbi:hypothetical protein LINPERPRIM_LOCUS29334, partial [Linum perenne]
LHRRRRSRPSQAEESRKRRSGARESKRRRSTTWFSSTKLLMTSSSRKLPSTSLSLPPSSPIVSGYVISESTPVHFEYNISDVHLVQGFYVCLVWLGLRYPNPEN